jgi:MFS family permease
VSDPTLAAARPGTRRTATLLGEPVAAWIALAVGVIAVCGHSATAYTVPVMMKTIIADLGWTRAEFAAAQATRTLGIGLSGLVWGVLTDRVGARAVLVAGALLCALGLGGFAAMDSLADAYVVGAVVGIGVGGLGPIAASALIARLFDRHRAIALGTLHAGDNLLTSFLPASTAAVAAALGWRGAAASLALGYVGIAVLLRASLPAGHSDVPRPSGAKPSLRTLPWRDPGLALIGLSFVVAYAFIGAVIYHLVAYQTDLGLPERFATRTMGNAVLAGFVGAVAAGWLAGRTRAATVLLVVHGILTLASAVLWLAPDEATLRLWPWVYGVAMGAYGPLLPLVLSERYGAEAPDLGTIIGAVSGLALLGAYLGNLAGALGHDAAGTYGPAWTAFSGMLLLALAFPACLLRVAPTSHGRTLPLA